MTIFKVTLVVDTELIEGLMRVVPGLGDAQHLGWRRVTRC